MTDLRASNHGSIVLILGQTDLGRAWMDENLQTESWQWFGPSLGVEWRCAADILEGAQCDGLTVEGF